MTSNTALKYFFGNGIKSDDLAAKNENDKRFVWDEVNQKMNPNNDGSYMVCYQIEENGYQPRSFEDDFIALNKQFVLDNDYSEQAIKASYKDGFDTPDKAYEIAKNVESKAAFAFEIFLNSKEVEIPGKEMKDPFGGWSIPTYIKEGLLWLRK